MSIDGGNQRKPRLSRETWTRAAFDSFTCEGIAEISIEKLAKELGATRGSFYWHFKDRSDLIDAVLRQWQRITLNVMRDLECISEPKERLAALLSASFEDEAWVKRELDLLSNASDPQIHQIVQAHTQERLAFIQDCLVQVGRKPSLALEQAAQSWALWVGASTLVSTMPAIISGRTPKEKLLALTRPVLADMLE